jgi:DNA-binding MarR family transcriptional regulator
VKSIHNTAAKPTDRAGDALSLLFQFTVLMSDAMQQDLAARGLTRARATVLTYLHRRGPMRQRELAEALRVTPRNVTGLLDALEAAEFVARSVHPSDRRATLVTLTGKGSAVAEAMQTDERHLAAFLFAGVDGDQLAGFVATLAHVVGRLGSEDLGALRSAATERWPSRSST